MSRRSTPQAGRSDAARSTSLTAGTRLRVVVKRFDELTGRELHDLLRLRTDVFVVEQECAYPELDGMDPVSVHALGHLASELVAYARWYPDGDAVVLGRIVTRRDSRQQGLSRQLMAAVLDVIGARSIRISAQLGLERYYRSLGFETVSEPYDDFGITHVDMVRDRRG